MQGRFVRRLSALRIVGSLVKSDDSVCANSRKGRQHANSARLASAGATKPLGKRCLHSPQQSVTPHKESADASRYYPCDHEGHRGHEVRGIALVRQPTLRERSLAAQPSFTVQLAAAWHVRGTLARHLRGWRKPPNGLSGSQDRHSDTKSLATGLACEVRIGQRSPGPHRC